MIRINFCKWHEWQNLEVVELQTYKEFFDFYVANSDKGCILDVRDDGNTK